MSFLWQVRREFISFFYSPIAWVIISISALLNGGMFFFIMAILANSGPVTAGPMEMLFSTILFWLVVLILTPLITMRSLAEERHTGTLETLVTAPISDTRIVLAKFVSCFVFYTAMWVPTLLYPVILSWYVHVDAGPILAGYLGTLALGAMLVAIGILCSALTRSQVVAAISTFASIMGIFLAGFFGFVDWVPFPDAIAYVSLFSHMETFAKGVVDTRPLVFYGSVVVFSLFASVQVLGARRWRQ